jgi:hypothetical protein
MKHWQKIGIVFLIVLAIAGINKYDAFEAYTAPIGSSTTSTTTTSTTTSIKGPTAMDTGLYIALVVCFVILLILYYIYVAPI